MQQSKAYGPEKQGLGGYDAVQNAKHQFGIAQSSKYWMREVMTIYKRKSVKDKHDGGRQTVVTVQNEHQTQNSSGDKRNTEIKGRSTYRLVELNFDSTTTGHSY